MEQTVDRDDIQGLAIAGYGNLKAAVFVLLEVVDPTLARAWLSSNATSITSCAQKPETQALNLAFTSAGLRKLGLKSELLNQFSNEFVSGMTTPHRSRLLGDLDENAPEGWLWGGPGGRSVDALLLLYAAEESRLQALYAVHAAALASAGLALVEKLQTAPLDRKEPFGFSDGISQPNVEGLPRNGTAENTIKIGEMVLGYQNEYGLYTDRPLVSRQDDPGGILPADAIGSGKADLGRNGTYLVLRHLEQDV